MNLLTILIVILIQIAIFQFVAVFLARSLPVVLVGERDLPAELRRDVERFRRRAGRLRLGLGVFLAAAAVGIVLLGVGPSGGKLFLAGVSLVSTLAMAAGYFRDRRSMRTLGCRRPDAGIRAASLEPRTLGRYYHPLWEAVPVAILLISAGFTVRVVSGGMVDGEAASGMLACLAFQALLVLGFLAYTLSSGLTGSSVASRLPMFRDRPEAAFALDDALRGTELRYFAAAKTGVALLLGLPQVEIAARAWRHQAALWLDAGGWILVVLLLVLFGRYVLRVARFSSQAAAGMQGGAGGPGGTALV